MISSVSGNRFAVQQTDYSQRQSAAFSTANPDQDVQQNLALKTDDAKSSDNKKTGELSESDLKVVSELKQRDAEVKAHEAAHLAAAGGIATGGASFSYQQGPDGIRYAIGGEVNIDTSGSRRPGRNAAKSRYHQKSRASSRWTLRSGYTSCGQRIGNGRTSTGRIIAEKPGHRKRQ